MQKIQNTLIVNLRSLMQAAKITPESLGEKTNITGRMIYYILNGEKIPTVEAVESLAKALGLEGWQLLIPNLSAELAKSGKLALLVKNYSGATDKGREYVDQVLEHEVKFKAK